jgi:hypothetical protein
MRLLCFVDIAAFRMESVSHRIDILMIDNHGPCDMSMCSHWHCLCLNTLVCASMLSGQHVSYQLQHMTGGNILHDMCARLRQHYELCRTAHKELPLGSAQNTAAFE